MEARANANPGNNNWRCCWGDRTHKLIFQERTNVLGDDRKKGLMITGRKIGLGDRRFAVIIFIRGVDG